VAKAPLGRHSKAPEPVTARRDPRQLALIGATLMIVAAAAGYGLYRHDAHHTTTAIKTATIGTESAGATEPTGSTTPSPRHPGRAATTTTTFPADSFALEVLNGNGATGIAASVATDLEAKGYTVTGTGNAPNFSFTTSIIYYPSDGRSGATALAADIAGDTALQPLATLGPHELELVIGSSFIGIESS
jgi:hypothetical protein